MVLSRHPCVAVGDLDTSELMHDLEGLGRNIDRLQNETSHVQHGMTAQIW